MLNNRYSEFGGRIGLGVSLGKGFDQVKMSNGSGQPGFTFDLIQLRRSRFDIWKGIYYVAGTDNYCVHQVPGIGDPSIIREVGPFVDLTQLVGIPDGRLNDIGLYIGIGYKISPVIGGGFKSRVYTIQGHLGILNGLNCKFSCYLVCRSFGKKVLTGRYHKQHHYQ